MMVIVPIDAEINEAQHIAQQTGSNWYQCQRCQLACGTFNSSTMIVMMMAITPSLNASSQLVFIFASAPE